MVKIYGILLLKWNPDTMKKPFNISSVFDLSSFGYFERSSVKEFMTFVSTLIVKKSVKGQNQTIKNDEENEINLSNYNVHSKLSANNIACVFVCDKDYPERIAFMAINQILNDPFILSIKIDIKIDDSFLSSKIVDFQNPANVDKLIKVKEDLDKTIEIVHKTIDSVIERGIKLDKLIKDSEELGIKSKMFYQYSAKQNKCCNIS